nr:hypothetical protein [Tanacetum cinerariifolium]
RIRVLERVHGDAADRVDLALVSVVCRCASGGMGMRHATADEQRDLSDPTCCHSGGRVRLL